MSKIPPTRSQAEIVNGEARPSKQDEAELCYEDLIGSHWADGWLAPS